MEKDKSYYTQLNMEKQCAAEGCRGLRHTWSKYCKHHRYRAYLFGHAYARAIRKSEYAKERSEVDAIFKKNMTHESFQSALEVCNSWLNGNSGICVEHAKRLTEANVTAWDVLHEVSSLSLFFKRNTHALPDKRSEMFCIGLSVIKLANNNGNYIPGKERNDVGWYLYSSLYPFLEMLYISIQSKKKYEQELNQKLSVPFNNE